MIRCLMLTASVLCLSGVAAAQTASTDATRGYPSKPIRLIVPYAAGSSPDITSRLVAHELSRQMTQQVVVDNRTGASAVIGTEMIARAAPDGYTLGYVAFPHATNPGMYAKLPYDSLRDFQPITSMLYSVNLLAVSPAQPIRSVKELIDSARANPEKLSYGSSGAGTSGTLSLELLKIMTATRITAISYKGAPQAIADVTAGRVDMICDNMASILPHAKAGRVRGLAVTSLKRSTAVPELPSIAEAGVAGFEVTPWSGYMFQAGVPRALVLRLNAEINKALLTQTVQEKFLSVGYTVGGGTPEQFTEFLRSEINKWGKVIKAAGIKPQ